MSDQFSIATKEAVLLLLGLQSAEYLHKYYAAYRSQDQDLARTADQLGGLLQSLQIIDERVRTRKWRPSEQTVLQNIERSIANCEDVINELQDGVQRLKKAPISTLSETIRVTGRRAAYPFRESTLKKLDEDVTELYDNLLAVVQALQLEDRQNTQGEEESVLSPADTGRKPASQYGHQYGNISIYSDARVHLGDTIIQNDVKEIENLMKDAQAHQLAASVRQWLRAPDATTDYNAACAKRYTGTGKWFVQSTVYIAWLQQENSFLWLCGFAGCGKSILCSTAIQHALHHARSQADSAVAFFFFAFNDESKQDTSALLRALLLQLYDQAPGLNTDLIRLQEMYKHGYPPVPLLLEYLRQAVKRCHHVYLLLDALDESPAETARVDVLSTIDTIRGWQLPSLHLLVTSRDILDIREGLNADTSDIVVLQNNNIDQDILLYVSYQVEHDRQLQRWGLYREVIKQYLTQRANGVFRWVDCQLQPLRQCPKSKYDLEECLKQLPPSLDETYERMLLGISQTCRERAQRLLTLLCFSSRPLTVPEAIDAIAVDVEGVERYDPNRKLENADDLLRICPGLIDITSHFSVKDHLSDDNNNPYTTSRVYQSIKRTEIVRIAHFSVQEYLLSPRIMQGYAASFAIPEAIGHFQISKTCLIYLCNQDFLNQAFTPELMRDYPFAYFAAKFWHYHYRLVDIIGTAETKGWGLALFQTRAQLERWVRIYDIDRPWKEEICYDKEAKMCATPIYYTSLLGLDVILSHLLSISTADINAQGGSYGNALQAASKCGYEKIVQILLDAGADVNAQGGRYDNALYAASEGGHEKIVQILVDAGANINAHGGGYGNALQAALEASHEKIVQILVNAGADINAQGGGYGNALYTASYRGDEKIMQILIDAGADINAQGGGYGNALYTASYRGHEKIAQILIDAGADVNAHGGFYGNALQAASEGGHEKIVQMLDEAGANVNAHGGRHGNALQAATEGSHEKIVQILIDAGADVNARGRYGNALYAASERGYENIVQILVDSGVDVNTRGWRGDALQAAAEGGHEKIVQILVDAGADVNTQRGFHNCALYAASKRGDERIVGLLIEAGADVDARGGFYGNALQAASEGGHEKIVQMLVGAGANVNAHGGRHGNALQAASEGGHEKIVQILIGAGADVNAKGGRYGNALYAASERGYEKIVQILVDAGSDINAHGGRYSYALSAASEGGHEKIVQVLVDAGADINAQGGGRYNNVLYRALKRGDESIVQILVDAGADINAQGGWYDSAL